LLTHKWKAYHRDMVQLLTNVDSSDTSHTTHSHRNKHYDQQRQNNHEQIIVSDQQTAIMTMIQIIYQGLHSRNFLGKS